MDPSCPAFSSATNATALSYAASFHVTDAENFKFLSARSRVQGKKLVIIPKPIEIAFVASKWIFFLQQDVGLTGKQLLSHKRKQKLIRDLSQRKTIGFAHPEQIGWI